MKKYNFIFFLFLLISSTMISSCGSVLSDLDQITAATMKCDVDTRKAQLYYEKYAKNNSKIYASDSVKQEAFAALSNMPEEYLEYVIGKHNIPMSLSSGKYNGGITYFMEYGTTMYPTNLRSEIWCFPHEFGHASEGLLRDKYPSTFKQDLSEISAIIAQKYQNKTSWYLRSYAYKSQWSRDRETFAELFDTWFCSQEARNRLKEGMPEVYDFAKKYLEETKNINLFIVKKDSNLRIYFANNEEYSNLSYCITTSDESCFDNKIKPSSFNNNTDNDNLFVSNPIRMESSSITLEVYSDDELVRKVNISK